MNTSLPIWAAREDDEECECIDTPISDRELEIARTMRKDPSYMPQKSFDVQQLNWTEDQILLLNPFWENVTPLSEEEFLEIAQKHAVNVARPGKECYSYLLETYAIFCQRKYEDSHQRYWLNSAYTYAILSQSKGVIFRIEQLMQDAE